MKYYKVPVSDEKTAKINMHQLADKPIAQ